MTSELFQFDNQFRENGAGVIAGVDEVGRGPLAGPVVVAAVILPADFCHPGIKDSKKMSAPQRERLDSLIRRMALDYSLVAIPNQVIDDINIRQATLLGMRLALKRLSIPVDLALIDGEKIPDWHGRQNKIIKGDARSQSIAAASIIAKVLRDNMMLHYDVLYPQYAFHLHKGYGTEFHRNQIMKKGISPIHRRTFIKKLIPTNE